MDDLRRASRFDVAAAAALLAEPARVAMLHALMDGQARPASELARTAGVAASTASAHLGALVSGGLLRVERLGRHRYHRLADERVAHALESLALLAPAPPAPVAETPERRDLRLARTCYAHLAGALGVGLVQALLGRRLLRRDGDAFRTTPAGRTALVELRLLEADQVRSEGRPCLDWTERRDHVAGPLGVALTKGLLEAGWVRHRPDSRALRITVDGARRFEAAFGLVLRPG